MFSTGIEGNGGIRRVPQPVFQKRETKTEPFSAERPPIWPQFSDLRKLVEKLGEIPDVRNEKVERAKVLLAEGSLTSDEALQRTAEAILGKVGDIPKDANASER